MLYLLRGSVTDESKAPRLASGVLHDLCRGDGAMGGKLSAQLVIIHTIIEILDVQVHTLVLGNLLLACLIKPVATKFFQVPAIRLCVRRVLFRWRMKLYVQIYH